MLDGGIREPWDGRRSGGLTFSLNTILQESVGPKGRSTLCAHWLVLRNRRVCAREDLKWPRDSE